MKHVSFIETLTSDKGQLYVTAEIGDVTIQPHDGRSITVEADLRHMTINVTRQDNVVSVRVEQEDKEWRQNIGRWFNADDQPKAIVTIHVPHTCVIHAKTITGQMHIHDIDAPVTATVITGKNDLANIGARVDARATTGEVTYNGFLTNDFHRFETVTGSIRLNLTQEPNAKLDGRVLTGDVHCALPLAQPKLHKALTGKHLKGTLGTGEGAIKAQIVTGSLLIQGNY